MNAIEIQDHMSCTSFSNHNPTDEVCDEKSMLISPKQQIDLSTGTIVLTTPSEEPQQYANIPKNVNVDLKQQFSSKLKLCSFNDNDPVKPIRSITPKRGVTQQNNMITSGTTDDKSDDKTNDENCYPPRSQQRWNSIRSSDSNDFTVSTVATTISSSSTTEVCTVPVKRKVRFAADKRGRVQCEYFRNLNPKSKEESVDCFYQMHDFQQFRRECKYEAMLQLKTSTYRDNFAKVYEACTTGNFKTVTRERAYISAASCRGLEVVVYPKLHTDRKTTIATVLQTQRSLPETMTNYNERSETIAAASRYLSKQARQLARVFGSGDAAVVIANQRIESLQQQQKPRTSSSNDSEDRVGISRSSNNDDTTPLQQVKQSKRKSNSKVVVPHCFVSC